MVLTTWRWSQTDQRPCSRRRGSCVCWRGAARGRAESGGERQRTLNAPRRATRRSRFCCVCCVSPQSALRDLAHVACRVCARMLRSSVRRSFSAVCALIYDHLYCKSHLQTHTSTSNDHPEAERGHQPQTHNYACSPKPYSTIALHFHSCSPCWQITTLMIGALSTIPHQKKHSSNFEPIWSRHSSRLHLPVALAVRPANHFALSLCPPDEVFPSQGQICR